MSAPSRFVSLRRAPAALTLVHVLLALGVVVFAFARIVGDWGPTAAFRYPPAHVPDPSPVPSPVPAPTLKETPLGPAWVQVVPNDRPSVIGTSVSYDGGWTALAAALIVTGCGLAAALLLRRRAYGTAALVSALPLLLHVAAAVVWSAGYSAGRTWDTLTGVAATPYVEISEGPERWLTLAAIAAGAVNAAVLARRFREPVAVRGLLGAQVALGAAAIVLALLPSGLPGQSRPFDRVSEGIAVPFGSAVIAAAVAAAVLHRTRARRLAPLPLLAPVVWLAWKLIPWNGEPRYVDLIGETGSFPEGSLQWEGVAEILQNGAWLATLTALLLSAACALVLTRRR